MAQKGGTAGEQRRRFEEEALPHLDALYTMAVRLARNSQDAGDLVQETILRAYRFFDRFELGTNCRAWLLTILFNNFRNGYRRSAREQPAGSPEEFERKIEAESLRLDAPNLNPEAALAESRMEREVEAALDALPAEFREALLLVDVQELSYQEISQVLNIPIGTVKSRVSRGRSLLREALTAYAKERGIIRS